MRQRGWCSWRPRGSRVAAELRSVLEQQLRPVIGATQGGSMDFSARVDELQQRVAATKTAVQAAATESRDQLRQRIDQAQQDAKDAQQRAERRPPDRARGKFAQMKADAAAVEQKRPARTAAAKTMRGRGRRGFREAARRQAGCQAGRWSGRDGRPDRDLGALSHRHPRRPRRLAGRAVAAVHSLPNDPRGIP